MAGSQLRQEAFAARNPRPFVPGDARCGLPLWEEPRQTLHRGVRGVGSWGLTEATRLACDPHYSLGVISEGGQPAVDFMQASWSPSLTGLSAPLRKLRSRPGGRGSLRASPQWGLTSAAWLWAWALSTSLGGSWHCVLNAGCGKIAHIEQSKQSAGAATMGTAGRRRQLEARGGRLRLGPGSPWSQESASTDPEGLKVAQGGLTQGVSQGHP